MLNKLKKISGEVKGFTLVEVMIGMMILTVAIVSASNLLTGIISSNRDNLTTLQAYYISQEGLEMVRNIRDTNWLHNKDWLGKATDHGSVWNGHFEIGKDYVVEMADAAGINSRLERDPPKIDSTNMLMKVASESPWKIQDAKSADAAIYRHDGYWDSNALGAAKDDNFNFKRTISIGKYECRDLVDKGIPCPDDKTIYILVKSKVTWTIGAKQRDLTLSEVLSNWKGGAL